MSSTLIRLLSMRRFYGPHPSSSTLLYGQTDSKYYRDFLNILQAVNHLLMMNYPLKMLKSIEMKSVQQKVY